MVELTSVQTMKKYKAGLEEQIKQLRPGHTDYAVTILAILAIDKLLLENSQWV